MSATSKKIEAVTIKGSHGGLLVRLRDGAELEWTGLLGELNERLRSGERFFKGGRAQVELGTRVIEADQLDELKAALAAYEIELATIISGAQGTRTLAKQAGLDFKLPNSQTVRAPVPVIEGTPGESQPAGGVNFDTAEALFLRRTIRGGQRIEHHADVIVLGDINPGAEIVAAGSVIVWGTVRGQIQAGQPNNLEAVICALSLQPTQLRIGGVVAVGGPEALDEPPPGPEIARAEDGFILVEGWVPKRTRR